MSVLQHLEPKPVFRFFEEICSIPHISHHEQELSDYCVAFARERGLFCSQDEMGNVLIVGEATPGYEQEDTVILQGHLDMVGDKAEGCDLDMEKEGLRLLIDGDYVTAEGTTLGGDDGIAVAYALALLDAEDIPHPRLEVVLTVCEEVGLLGASAMDLSMCRGKRLLNVDSEMEGVLTVGCAGGRRAKCRIPMNRVPGQGLLCRLVLKGLAGGHSGTEIDKGRANANVLLGRVLMLLRDRVPCALVSLAGGAKENVIPKDGRLELLVKPDQLEELKAVIEEFHRQMGSEYGTADPDICLELIKGEEKECQALDAASLDKVAAALNLMPNGVQAMSMDLPGLVETSLNMGVVELEGEELVLRFSIRSSVPSAKEQLAAKVQLLTRMLGGETLFQGDYPAWPYARESGLRDLCISVFEAQYGRKPEVQTLHAGLECGILSDKIEGLDCISFGPDQLDIHTPNERLSISSVGRVWEYIKAVLAAK
ncbi:MAG: aminoacyl-histidine dipeptidase [Clostridiales bacterium]|nr:aminoacyl-histidine dipeptidase [Clostridiales bacterium]